MLYCFVVLLHDRCTLTSPPILRHNGQLNRSSRHFRLTRLLDIRSVTVTAFLGNEFPRRVEGLGIEEIMISPRSPWQKPYCERLIGSIRRECLNHMIVLSEAHLKRILKSYFQYYHKARTHLSLDRNSPTPRAV